MERSFLILLAVLVAAVAGCLGTIECLPDCTGRQCGGDGCQGSCGVCSAGLTCSEQAGVCQSPTCGNGQLDQGETCDPPSTCPSTCDDGEVCTTDRLVGSIQGCTAECQAEPITSCGPADGCCPTGCDHQRDEDCPDACGNGQLDQGETCDPPASCPTSCDDGNPCTAEQLTGSAQSCTAFCQVQAITACSGGDACCPPSCDHASDADCPACGGLSDRIQITSVDLSPASINQSAPAYWSPQRPIILSPLAGGGAMVAWHGSDGKIHVTPLNAVDARQGPDWLVQGDEVRGFVAHVDGAAVLRVQGDAMELVRLTAAGQESWTVTFVGNNDHVGEGDEWVDDWGHAGFLTWDGAQYASYFGLTRDWGAQGKHQGDKLTFVDASGIRQGDGWWWGCSHSTDVRLRHNGVTLGPLCLSDCYPGKGVYFNHNTLVSVEDGNCAGTATAALGGLVGDPDGFYTAFVSMTGKQGDIGFSAIANSGVASTVVWLTDTPADPESAVHLTRYGANLLLFWFFGGQHWVQELDRAGVKIGAAQQIQAPARNDDDFTNFPNGDVGWATGQGSTLQIVRLRLCQ